MKREQIKIILERCLLTGADFSEVFIENTVSNSISLSNQKIDKVKTSFVKGIGIRICLKDKRVYGYTNKLTTKNINKIIDALLNSFNSEIKIKEVKLQRIKKYRVQRIIEHDDFAIEKKLKVLKDIDTIARSVSDKISQVEASLIEKDSFVTIANSNGLYVSDDRILNRLSINVYAKENDKIESSGFFPGYGLGYEYLDKINIEDEVKKVANKSISKLTAIQCPNGEMPVIIGNGFGGVIFHEACVHALEATTVAKGTSIFNDMLNQKIASDKVTIIDDGTLVGEWGSSNIDDEGNPTRRNILIDKGVLTSYLIDNINAITMKTEGTSSARRESYCYSPTSRMNNTYLEAGTDKIEDMIKSIEYGLYAKDMGGGSVNPVTGDFNFSVREAFLIEKGQITKQVNGASLVGNGKDIIKRVSMVSNDLKLGTGMCGSDSGNIPVTVGQPTIKVDKILVGGKGEKVNV